jgi:hypothetical protein
MAKPIKRTMDQFGIAESLGEIHTMPEIEENLLIPKDEITLIDNPEDFRMAVGQAAMNGEEYVEVSEKLFKYLLKNSKSRYLTYGDPGIKVYKVGTREENEKIDKMSADAFLEYDSKQKTAGLNV